MKDKNHDTVRLTEQDEMIGRFIVRKTGSDTSEGPCLTDEEIAMFLDGHAEGRERMMEHLSACGSCRSILKEAADIREDLNTALPARHISFIWYAVPVAMAAVLLLAVMFRNPFSNQGTPKHMSLQAKREEMKPPSTDVPEARKDVVASRDLLKGLPSADMIAKQLLSGGNRLSLIGAMKTDERVTYGFASSVQAEKNAFRAGVLLTDLEVSLRAGDREKSEMFLRALVAALEAEGDATAPISASKAALTGLEQNRPVKTYAGISREVVGFFSGKSLADFVAFGSWAEGGRLAAAIEKSDFLTYYNHHNYFIRAVREKDLSQGIETSLKKIRLITEKKEAQQDHLKRLEREFQNLILLMD